MPALSHLSTARRIGRRAPEWLKAPLRPLARRVRLAASVGDWEAIDTGGPVGLRDGVGAVCCNICGWAGGAFAGVAHVESADCPRCGSVARDRFLLWCAAVRGGLGDGMRVLETSPRMGRSYRAMMGRNFQYHASDFDLGAHRADVQIDLQDIALPTASLDLLLTAHVLEHVPDTVRALSEMHRVVAPGGRAYVQVPLLQGITAPPPVPEYHGDDTLVFWRFGWDLTDMLRAAGFTTAVLVVDEFADVLSGSLPTPAPVGDIFDVADLVRHARPADIVAVADAAQTARMGWRPAHQFVTWECVRF